MAPGPKATLLRKIDDAAMRLKCFWKTRSVRTNVLKRGVMLSVTCTLLCKGLRRGEREGEKGKGGERGAIHVLCSGIALKEGGEREKERDRKEKCCGRVLREERERKRG